MFPARSQSGRVPRIGKAPTGISYRWSSDGDLGGFLSTLADDGLLKRTKGTTRPDGTAMRPMDINPYESPKSDGVRVQQRQHSFARAFAWTVAAAILGFCVPFAALGIPLLLGVTFADVSLGSLPEKCMDSAVVCSLMFAAAAFANYLPHRGIGFVRSLVVMGIATIFAGFATASVARVFDFGPQSHRFDSYRWLWVTIFATLLFVIAVCFTYWQMRQSDRRQ